MSYPLEEPLPTRNEVRALLTDPKSTKKQILEAKLMLLKRVMNGADAVQQICEHYRLTAEQTENLAASDQKIMAGLRMRAAEKLRNVERLLTELNEE